MMSINVKRRENVNAPVIHFNEIINQNKVGLLYVYLKKEINIVEKMNLKLLSLKIS